MGSNPAVWGADLDGMEDSCRYVYLFVLRMNVWNNYTVHATCSFFLSFFPYFLCFLLPITYYTMNGPFLSTTNTITPFSFVFVVANCHMSFNINRIIKIKIKKELFKSWNSAVQSF